MQRQTLQAAFGHQDSTPAAAANSTGMPDQLKAGIESLSGMDMSDVRVHRNSDKPAQLSALAYAQGNEIHLGPGQEQHLPHEAWHVVQQRQGRVRATMQMAGVAVNDDAGLEREADAMGARAVSQGTAGVDAAQQTPAQLRKTAGQGIVAQRQLTVDNIDFNPVTGQYRHGYIDQAPFLAAMTTVVTRTALYANYRGQWNNVLGTVRNVMNAGAGLHAADVPTLVTTIATAAVNAYNGRGLVAFAALQADFEADITPALVANIRPDPGARAAMTPQESGAYDVLRNIVTDAHMSRRKGTANPLPYANLPGGVKTGVDAVLRDLRTERALWQGVGIRNLNISYFLPPPNEQFSFEILQRQRGKRYQGNHTNNAGWLPAVAAPPNHVELQHRTILTGAGAGLAGALNGGTPLATLGIAKGQVPTADGQQFIAAVAAARGAVSNAQLVESVGAALAQGVSGYIEFSMPGDISRLVYDAVNGNVYVSAHYKWRLGYNPWFEITGAPAV